MKRLNAGTASIAFHGSDGKPEAAVVVLDGPETDLILNLIDWFTQADEAPDVSAVKKTLGTLVREGVEKGTELQSFTFGDLAMVVVATGEGVRTVKGRIFDGIEDGEISTLGGE